MLHTIYKGFIFIILWLCVGVPEDLNKFSDRWHAGFLKRHRNIAIRVTFANNRKKAREWNNQRCNEWINLLEGLTEGGGFNDPAGIWNADETGMPLGEVYDKVYAAKGSREVDSYFDGDEKERLTVLACGNAAGLMLRPLILYDGKVDLLSRLDGTNDRCWVGTNSSGYMDNDLFTAYFKHEVIPNMTAYEVHSIGFQLISDLYLEISFQIDC